MPTLEVEVIERNAFLGEIETEIVGMQHHKARMCPGEQVNLERKSDDRHAIRVENGRFDAVGYLPQAMASWLAPLIDNEQIHLDGYVQLGSDGESNRCPVNLMVFQCEKGRRFFKRTDPRNELEALHQVILQAYQDAQGYSDPESIQGLIKELRPLEKQRLLPESLLLLALLPKMAYELRMAQRFCDGL
jgi:hypothetical protein